MRLDVRQFFRVYLPCLARDGAGRQCKPELMPIPVGGPFERVGVDVLKRPKTERAMIESSYLSIT